MTKIISLLLFSFNIILASAQSLAVGHLTCEYKTNPIGIDVEVPRLGWTLEVSATDQNIIQAAYQIRVANNPDDLSRNRRLVWDSGKQDSDQSIHIPYSASPASSRQRLYWQVKVWDNQNRESEWSEIAWWEYGLLDESDWSAQWIGVPWEEEEEEALYPSPYLRNTFDLERNIARARLYITSHGLYNVKINGEQISQDLFTPGWTSYDHRLQYQTYDVTELLASGKNAIGVILGDGWYRGQFGFRNNWNIYGDKLALLCQLEVEYRNGRKEIIYSDGNWKTTTGPIRYSSIYDGELYDAREELEGYSLPSFDDTEWQPVKMEEGDLSVLIAPQGPPVRRIMEIQPEKIWETPKGELVVDFGQNMVGWVKIKVEGNAGDTVTLHHAEVLDKNGNFYTDNLRSAQQQIKYILNGEGEETYEPHFTFQGFRYVMVEGFPEELTTDHLTGVVIHSEMDPTGTFECSDALLNQLQSNIEWGQRGNFLDVPTDCPQRDERMGWTGDAQAFAPTACYNFNSAAFFTKWLGDLAADQQENGSVPFVVPSVLNGYGSTGWGDAATIVPWTVYQKYGDKRILEEQWESMEKWVLFLKELAGEDLIIQDGFHFGDWLFFIHPTDWNAKPGYSDIDFLATAFYAYSTDLLARSAKILNKHEAVSTYTALFDRIKDAFQNEFITESGRISPHSQTAYTLALTFNLLKENQIEQAVNYLVADITKRDFHLSTGFLGTPHLCKVLSDHGKQDVAFKLILQKTYPSWLYPVTRGATTIWERWDGIKPDSSFQDIRMNSFNHYAYGAIGHWMYSEVAGLSLDPVNPGYKHIIIQPHVDASLEYANTSFASMYGEIKSGWKLQDGELTLDIQIPPNTTATIHFPNHPEGDKTEEIGSGSYTYTYDFTEKTM